MSTAREMVQATHTEHWPTESEKSSRWRNAQSKERNLHCPTWELRSRRAVAELGSSG
jgi:hypothetical protein